MSAFTGFRCDGCNQVEEVKVIPNKWMTIRVQVDGGGYDKEFTVCSNLCLERLGRNRKNADRELVNA